MDNRRTTAVDLLVAARWRLRRAWTLLDDADQQQALRVSDVLLAEIQKQLDPIFRKQAG